MLWGEEGRKNKPLLRKKIMPDDIEQRSRIEQPGYHSLRHLVANACHVLGSVLELEKKNLSKENIAIAEEQLNNIMAAVDNAGGVTQPEGAEWICSPSVKVGMLKDTS